MMSRNSPNWARVRTALFAGSAFLAGALSSLLLQRIAEAFVTGPRNETETLLYDTTPVTIDIRYVPKVIPVDGVTKVSGPAKFTFTNRTDRAIGLAFPPHRVFGIRWNQYSEEATLPEFAAAKRAVVIPARESVTFESPYATTMTGDADSFLRGGLGWVGFVFDRPPEEESAGEFFVGTVFPRYSAVASGE